MGIRRLVDLGLPSRGGTSHCDHSVLDILSGCRISSCFRNASLRLLWELRRAAQRDAPAQFHGDPSIDSQSPPTALSTQHSALSVSRYVQLLRALVVSLTSFSTMASFSTIVFGASDVTFLGAHGKIIGSSVHVNVDFAAWEGLTCPLIPHIANK
jgi:hypothetical protein